MKKKVLIIGVLCAVVISVLSFLVIKLFMLRTTYELSPKMTEALFSESPEEFFDTFYENYNYCEDFRDRAEIKDGNLVLHLTKWQEVTRRFHNNYEYKMFEKIDGVEIADDYTALTISGTETEIGRIIFEEMPLYLVFDMGNRQLFSGKDPETISVTVTLFNEETKETMYTASWPDEEIHFNFYRRQSRRQRDGSLVS